MARGHKTGGRQKGTPNKATVRLDAKLAEAAERAIAGLSPSEIATIMPLEVMLLTMRFEMQSGQLRSAASIAEKAAPYVHPKMAPRAEEGAEPQPATLCFALRYLPYVVICRSSRLGGSADRLNRRDVLLIKQRQSGAQGAIHGHLPLHLQAARAEGTKPMQRDAA
jgi:hypothetical protein